MERLRSTTPQAGFPPRLRGPLAITHVNVVTMESPQLLPDRTVVIEEGVIRAIAPATALDVTGMQCIDGSNRFLMPGLADMHTHVTDAGVCRLYLANGVTRVRNMDGRPWHLALAKQVEQGQLPGPRIVSVSPLIDGLGEQGLTARPNSLVLTDPGQGEALVRRLVARGYSEIKAYQWLGLDALRSLGVAAAHAGVRMAGHCPDGLTFEQSIAAGMGCFEHLTGIATGHLREGMQFATGRNAASRRGTRESLELMAHHLDFDALRRLAHAMAAKGIWNCPTLVVWQQQIQLPELALADPDLQFEHPAVVREWERLIKARFASLPCPPDEWLALGRARDVALAKVVSILHEEGAPLLLGTDAPNPFVVQGCSIHRELANLVRAGLSPYDALRCGTAEAARFLGESDISGSVAAGKRADLLLLRANPLLDVGAVRSGLEAVFVNGCGLTRLDLDSLLTSHLATLTVPPAEPQSAPGEVGRSGIARQGSFEEWTGDVCIGHARYHHKKSPDGGWEVEERSARSGPRGPQRCTSRLWLGPDWTVREACIEAETDVGTERSEITWSDGAYRVRITQPDGYVGESMVRSAPLLPSERLAFSVLPAWSASQTAPVLAASLSIEHEVAQTVALAAERLPASAADGHGSSELTRRIRVTHPGDIVTQSYTFSPDGELASLQDLLFGAPRRLLAESALQRRAAQPSTGT